MEKNVFRVGVSKEKRVGRSSTIKIKINGLCTNKCSFCNFNNDKSLLSLDQINFFFDHLKGVDFSRVVINGGEPTIHPDYLNIINYHKEHFGGKINLELGTNLVPFARKSNYWRKLFKRSLAVFDRFLVGCDNEHGNIDLVEELAPVIVSNGVNLAINVVEPYCSQDIRDRLYILNRRYGIRLRFSPVMHHCKQSELKNDILGPCDLRDRDFLLNCNGDAFFCHEQEHENPLFNLFELHAHEISNYLLYQDPGIYKFCEYCPKYVCSG